MPEKPYRIRPVLYTTPKSVVFVQVDTFLRDNLDWMGRASNWAKFTATASIGVVHRGHMKESMNLLQPYLPQGGVSALPYSEGGALYALGLIHSNKGSDGNAEVWLSKSRRLGFSIRYRTTSLPCVLAVSVSVQRLWFSRPYRSSESILMVCTENHKACPLHEHPPPKYK